MANDKDKKKKKPKKPPVGILGTGMADKAGKKLGNRRNKLEEAMRRQGIKY